MKRVVMVALLLLAAQFLLPVLLLRGQRSEQPPTLRPAGQTDWDEAQTVALLDGDGGVEPLPLSDYLWGVVAAEMPAAFEPEALKAQTVAARTYWAAASGDKHSPADICGDSACCQAYVTRDEAAERWGGAAAEYTEKIARAVAETDGMILVYEDKPIQAAYFSSAPGRTVDAAAVWGTQVPYLVSVSSPEGEEVPNWRTEVSLSTQQFRELVAAQYPAADFGGPVSQWLRDFVWEPSGVVRQVNVGGVTLTGGQVRKLLGLRSACFSVSAVGEELVFETTGYGHGVGMSQYGANAMAKQGATCSEILGWYYTGARMERMK